MIRPHPGGAQGLADSLAWLMDHGDEAARIAHDARRRVEAEFDSRAQGVRLAGLYRDLVESGTWRRTAAVAPTLPAKNP